MPPPTISNVKTNSSNGNTNSLTISNFNVTGNGSIYLFIRGDFDSQTGNNVSDGTNTYNLINQGQTGFEEPYVYYADNVTSGNYDITHTTPSVNTIILLTAVFIENTVSDSLASFSNPYQSRTADYDDPYPTNISATSNQILIQMALTFESGQADSITISASDGNLVSGSVITDPDISPSYKSALIKKDGPSSSIASIFTGQLGGRGTQFVLAVSIQGLTSIPCFIKDTPIKTVQGYKSIQDLTSNDYIIDKMNNNYQIDNILKEDINISDKNILVLIKKNSLGHFKPTDDIITTAYHRFEIEGRQVEARELINNSTIYYYDNKEISEVYHVKLKNNEWRWMIVNDILAETLKPE